MKPFLFFSALLMLNVSLAAAADASRPLIGITADFEPAEGDTTGQATTQMSYVNAVLESGGLPVVLPPIRSEAAIADYLDRLDGLLLVGGMDLWPSAYGEKPHPTVDSLEGKRFWFESRLIKAWLEKSDKPILGICLGCQFTNVVCGGSLVQDIPSQWQNPLTHRLPGGAAHEVTLVEGSRLRRLFARERLAVNSNHHQAVKCTGAGLVVAARADDGIVEALERPGERFAVFVQWHPERLEEAHRRTLFGAFVEACR